MTDSINGGRPDLQRAEALLREHPEYTCVFVRGQETVCDVRRGVKPLLALYDSGKTLAGFSAADKVVGRGAALLYALLGLENLYAGVLSESAEEVLRAHDIYYEYGTRVRNVVNRKGDGICPMEKATSGIFDPLEGLKALRAALSALEERS